MASNRPPLTLLIIPGLGESSREWPYREIKRRCQRAFPQVCLAFHQPTWSYRTADHWITAAEKTVLVLNPPTVCLLGFSLGAYIALAVAARLPVAGAQLCSLSPFFKETMGRVPGATRKFFGKRRVNDFSRRSMPASLKTKADFYFGGEDWPLGIETAKKLAQRHDGGYREIPGVGHELSELYIETVLEQLRKLLKRKVPKPEKLSQLLPPTT